VSPLDRPVPPTGEEIHIPGGSAQPILLTIGITMVLLGLTVHVLLVISGLVLSIVVLAAWVRDAIEEWRHLPAEHHVVVADTVPEHEQRSDAH
jgi:Na+-transporting methylmalonyl-CoA/oxaloacetate decarboxylase gamma subunit